MTTPSTPTPSPFALVLRHVDQGVVNVEEQSPDGWIAIHVAHLHSELVRRLVAIQPDLGPCPWILDTLIPASAGEAR